MTDYFPEHATAFASAAEALRGRRIAVLGHLRPDGDCIGSQVALARVLRQHFQVDAVCLNGHRVPRACATFVGDTPFFQVDDLSSADFPEAAVAVDCADMSRFGEKLNSAYPDILLNVDHHISNTGYANCNIVEGESSATAELLGAVFLGNGYPVDPVTAQALYVGIATDTGQFRFSSTTFRTFEICRELIRLGADPAAAAMELYERESPEKIALLQHFLASFEFLCDGRVCIGVLNQQAWDQTGAGKEDTEGLVDYARCMDGVEIGVLIEERDGEVKGSFRAKDPVQRVDLLAKRFNGGGHACAAGFNPKLPLNVLLPRLRKALREHFESQG